MTRILFIFIFLIISRSGLAMDDIEAVNNRKCDYKLCEGTKHSYSSIEQESYKEIIRPYPIVSIRKSVPTDQDSYAALIQESTASSTVSIDSAKAYEKRSFSKNPKHILYVIVLIIGVIILIVLALYRSQIMIFIHNEMYPLRIWNFKLFILFLLNGLMLGMILELSLLGSESSVNYLFKFLNMYAGWDSWHPMSSALEYLNDQSDIPLYSKILFEDHIKFQYPPSALLLLDLGQSLTKLSGPPFWFLLNVLSWICVIAIGVIGGHLLYETIKQSHSSNNTYIKWPDYYITIALGIAITLTFYPLTRSFYLGQIQTFIIFLVGLSFLSWHYKNPVIAGILIGLCCAIKPQWGIVLIWGVFRKQWKFVAASAVSGGVFAIVSIVTYGFIHWLDYFNALSFIGRHGESFHANQSVNGLMNRFLFNGNNLNWIAETYAPFNSTVYIVTIGSTLLIIGIALFYKRKLIPQTSDFALILLTLTIASPIAWEHHYGVILFVLAVVSPIAMSRKIMGKYTGLYIACCMILTSNLFEFTDRFANSYLNPLQSYLFFGSIMLLILLYRTNTKVPFQKGASLSNSTIKNIS